jgi:hypothetical protein
MAHGRTLNAYEKMVTLYDYEMEDVVPPTKGWFQVKGFNVK